MNPANAFIRILIARDSPHRVRHPPLCLLSEDARDPNACSPARRALDSRPPPSIIRTADVEIDANVGDALQVVLTIGNRLPCLRTSSRRLGQFDSISS